MSADKKIGSLTLKRTVAIKVIVTEDFKKYLTAELQNAIRTLAGQLKQLEEQGKKLLESLTKIGTDDAKKQAKQVEQQMEIDRQQQMRAKNDLNKKIAEAQNLKIGSEFTQGTVDGFVQIKPKDNLYEKLGAAEIIIKDGIIQSINKI